PDRTRRVPGRRRRHGGRRRARPADPGGRMTATANGTPTAAHAAPPAGRHALDVAGLSGGYGPTTVLRDVSVQIARGEVTALLGSNGAGKTTLLRTVSGLLPAQAGSVRLHGVDVTREKPHRRF